MASGSLGDRRMSNRSLLAVLVLSLVGVFCAGLMAGCSAGEIDEGAVFHPAPKADQPLPDMAQPPPPKPDLSLLPDLSPIPDMTCGGMEFPIERVPPNVMLVLDRSG